MANREQVVRDLDRVIGLIKTDAKDIPAETKQQMMKETIHHSTNMSAPAGSSTESRFPRRPTATWCWNGRTAAPTSTA